jgi:hypothetical protein
MGAEREKKETLSARVRGERVRAKRAGEVGNSSFEARIA